MMKRLKVGILTLPLHHNYGGILQAYALQKYLTRLGCEAYMINRIFPKSAGSLKEKIHSEFSRLVLEQNVRKFATTYISPKTNTIDDNDKLRTCIEEYQLEAVIVGSDQVWRLEYSKSIALNFFFDFAQNSSLKRVTYAASFGVDSWEHDASITKKIKVLMSKIDSISVREDSAVKICKDDFGLDAVQMIDPTLLLTAEDYSALIEFEDRLVDKETLAYYLLDTNDDKLNIVNRIAREKNLSAVSINVKRKFRLKEIIYLSDCIFPTVTRWLSGIQASSFIVTDSFHGVAFSIIFKKPFIAIGNAERGLARFTSILNAFGLRSRLIFNSAELTSDLINQPVDFNRVSELNDIYRTKAKDFLNNSLGLN